MIRRAKVPLKFWLPGILGERQDRVRMMARKVTSSDQLFKRRHFGRDVIVLCVRFFKVFSGQQ
jgi:hypothetical protein